jgi:hypothetical protein
VFDDEGKGFRVDEIFALAMASLPTLVITAVAEAPLASGVEVVYVETPAKVFCP